MANSSITHIGDMLRAVTAHAPTAPAFVAEDLSLTRAQFLTVCERYAARMANEGIKRGQLVSLNTADQFASVACCFALSFLGVRYIPFGNELLLPGAPRVDHFLRDVMMAPNPGCTEITVDGSWFQENRTSFKFEKIGGFNCGKDVCWVSPSSGTTGRAKYAEISVDLLNKRVAAVAHDYADGSTRLMILFHGGSRPFIIRAVAALAFGHVLVDHSSPDFAEANDVNFICASPQQIIKWLGGKNLKQRSFRRLQLSGAKVSHDLVDSLLADFDRVEDVYGSNETIKCLIKSWQKSPEGAKAHTIIEEGAALQVVDINDHVVAPGTEGRVRIRTRYMIDGYLNDVESTKRHFRDGWFYPGDVGIVSPDGQFHIHGREGEIGNFGGQKVLLSDIEAALMNGEGIRAASCFFLSDKSGASRFASCLELDSSTSKLHAVLDAWRKCSDRFGKDAVPEVFLIVQELKLTSDGVAVRRLAKDQFEHALRNWSETELSENLFSYGARQHEG